MSSTNRGTDRKGFDDYPTPVDAIDLFLEAAPPGLLRAGRWLEPCAGEGRIIERVERAKGSHATIDWHAWEIQNKYQRQLTTLGISSEDAARFIHLPPLSVRIGDCLTLQQEYPHQYFDVAITNPPYNQAMPILLALRRIAHTVVLLLRRNFIGSAKRAEYLRDNMPDEYLLPKRPSFVWRHAYKLQCLTCQFAFSYAVDVRAGKKSLPRGTIFPDALCPRCSVDGKGLENRALAIIKKVVTTRTDSVEYCWCVFTPKSGPVGTTRMLALLEKS